MIHIEFMPILQPFEPPSRTSVSDRFGSSPTDYPIPLTNVISAASEGTAEVNAGENELRCIRAFGQLQTWRVPI